MGIKIGENLEVGERLIENEFRIGLTMKYVDALVKKNKLKDLSDSEIDKLRKEVLHDMQIRYPDLGLKF